MITVLASPTEPKTVIDALGAIISSLCEEYGADYLIYTSRGLWGTQRKEVPNDFISSFTDGRMAKETSLLEKHCQYRELVCEGRFRYYPDTHLALGRKEPSWFTRKQIKGMLLNVKLVKGIDIVYTDDMEDTISYIKSIVEFMATEKHLGLYVRPNVKGTWNVPTAEDTDLWLLQSFPGIGPSIADNIIQHFGGVVPMRWACSLEELMRVPKLSKKRAEALWCALPMGTIPKEKGVFDVLRSSLGNKVQDE